ncbi:MULTISPECIES: ABC transporter substrate-binding protein [Catenuloplanes]|uniref:Multiple sugar transport system substrate-binding protein n=1 Tax=Catenuloplanes niger TaxID=587534 RepID=A0AAE4CUE7_9ACTN|nr:extracellular solute-binding protein [Catenuloplanes niger]MDR7325060.1 multiple sugar transport system substrate-binding protein [Catenuloplanes niger]
MASTKRFRAALAVLLLAGRLTACGGGDDAGGDVTLRFSWWGNADRAALMQQSIDLFQAANPTITVTPSFQEFEAYWQKMATETAGGNAPDVLQMDFAYLREYADRNVLLDLKKTDVRVDDLIPAFQGVGEVDGALYGVPTGGNTWCMFYNPALLAAAGVEEPAAGITWDQYHALVDTVSKKGAGRTYGGSNYRSVIYSFESYLLQRGGTLYTEDGALGFTEQQLIDYWTVGKQYVDDGRFIPSEKVAQIEPASPITKDLIATEFRWDNFFARYAAETEAELKIGPVPVTAAGGPTGQYLKPAMLLSASARTDHPDEAAKLISFLINDPQVGRIFGSNRGIPATNAQREAAVLEGPALAIAEYEKAIAPLLQKAPPAPPKGAGTVEAAFLRIADEISYGRSSVPDAVDTFFTEAEDTLAG